MGDSSCGDACERRGVLNLFVHVVDLLLRQTPLAVLHQRRHGHGDDEHRLYTTNSRLVLGRSLQGRFISCNAVRRRVRRDWEEWIRYLGDAGAHPPLGPEGHQAEVLEPHVHAVVTQEASRVKFLWVAPHSGVLGYGVQVHDYLKSNIPVTSHQFSNQNISSPRTGNSSRLLVEQVVVTCHIPGFPWGCRSRQG